MTFKPALKHASRTTAQLRVVIEKQEKILQALQAVLPAGLSKQAKACVIKETKLLVYTDSAAWSSQLRFFSQAMKAAANGVCGDDIDKIQIKVQPPIRPITQAKSSKKIPSSDNIEAIRASQLQEPESPLKLAILKLSRTLKNLSGV